MKTIAESIRNTITSLEAPHLTKPLEDTFYITKEKALESVVLSCVYCRLFKIDPPQTPHFQTIPKALDDIRIASLLDSIDYSILIENQYGLYESYLEMRDRRSAGVWYTPQPVVNFMTHNALRFKNALFTHDKVKYIDPSLGTGIFANTLYTQTQSDDILGFDIDFTCVCISILIRQSLQTTLITSTQYLCQDYLEYSQSRSLSKDTVPIIIGNPPYGKGYSFNYTPITDYQIDSIDEYGFPARRFAYNKGIYHTLKDLYICFIKASQEIITRAGKGILVMITNDSFLVSNSFVGMRFNLLNHFNKMYIIKLNGDHKLGSPRIPGDKNIFNIRCGVTIFFLIRTHHPGNLTNTPQCEVYFDSIYGSKEDKFHYLTEGIDNIIEI